VPVTPNICGLGPAEVPFAQETEELFQEASLSVALFFTNACPALPPVGNIAPLSSKKNNYPLNPEAGKVVPYITSEVSPSGPVNFLFSPAVNGKKPSVAALGKVTFTVVAAVICP
jgi:hypothetical protein